MGRSGKSVLEHYDTCIEAAGNMAVCGHCVELAKPNGQLVFVGNPDVNLNVGQKLYRKILRKQLTVRGSRNSSCPPDWTSVLDYAAKLGLDRFFISHRYKFNELDQPFEMMRRKPEKQLKVIALFE